MAAGTTNTSGAMVSAAAKFKVIRTHARTHRHHFLSGALPHKLLVLHLLHLCLLAPELLVGIAFPEYLPRLDMGARIYHSAVRSNRMQSTAEKGGHGSKVTSSIVVGTST